MKDLLMRVKNGLKRMFPGLFDNDGHDNDDHTVNRNDKRMRLKPIRVKAGRK